MAIEPSQKRTPSVGTQVELAERPDHGRAGHAALRKREHGGSHACRAQHPERALSSASRGEHNPTPVRALKERGPVPMACGMSVNDLVLVQGMADTKLALSRWNERPWTVLRPWLRLSFGIAVLLLLVVYVIAKLTTPDSSRYILPGVNSDAGLDDYVAVLFRNSLVLALHAMACVAGFIAGSAMPLSASHRSGFSRWVHEKAGTLRHRLRALRHHASRWPRRPT